MGTVEKVGKEPFSWLLSLWLLSRARPSSARSSLPSFRAVRFPRPCFCCWRVPYLGPICSASSISMRRYPSCLSLASRFCFCLRATRSIPNMLLGARGAGAWGPGLRRSCLPGSPSAWRRRFRRAASTASRSRLRSPRRHWARLCPSCTNARLWARAWAIRSWHTAPGESLVRSLLCRCCSLLAAAFRRS